MLFSRKLRLPLSQNQYRFRNPIAFWNVVNEAKIMLEFIRPRLLFSYPCVMRKFVARRFYHVITFAPPPSSTIVGFDLGVKNIAFRNPSPAVKKFA